MQSRDDTPLARAFDAVLDEPAQPTAPRVSSEARLAMWIVLLALLLVVLAVRLGVQPLMEATIRLSMATERQRVLTAIQAYSMLDQLPAIPARSAPRRILVGDADAPFARFLQGPTRYAYRWFEDGLGVHAVGQDPLEAHNVLAVAALAHDLLQGVDAGGYSVPPEGDWSARLEAYLVRHIEAGNALGLVNPVSGEATVGHAGELAAHEAAPAVLISDAPVHAHRYLARQPDGAPLGSIVVHWSEDGGKVEVFFVGPDGSPAYLLVASGAGTLPRRMGW